jgi:uncharacterized protein with PQ loop repeat
MPTFDFALGWILVFGSWLSFFPQHLKIYENESNEGLSFSNFALATLVVALEFLNFTILGFNSTFKCCTAGVSAYSCCAAYIAFLQQVVCFVCKHITIVLLIYYYDEDFGREKDDQKEKPEGFDWKRTKYGTVTLILVEIILCVLALIFGAALGMSSAITITYGVFLGICASLIVIVQWMPQIYTTWKLRKVGSLSMSMLVLQSIGCVFTAYILSAHGGWEIWAPYIVAAFFQSTCLCLGFYLHWGNKCCGGDISPEGEAEQKGKEKKEQKANEDAQGQNGDRPDGKDPDDKAGRKIGDHHEIRTDDVHDTRIFQDGIKDGPQRIEEIVVYKDENLPGNIAQPISAAKKDDAEAAVKEEEDKRASTSPREDRASARDHEEDLERTG